MPPLPKRRWSTHRQGKKRKKLGIKLPGLVACPNCGALIPPHRVCVQCGHYKGKKVVKKRAKTHENAKRSKAPRKKKSN